MKHCRQALLLSFLLFFSVAHAVNKCTIAGKIEYRETPCDTSADQKKVDMVVPKGALFADKKKIYEIEQREQQEYSEKRMAEQRLDDQEQQRKAEQEYKERCDKKPDSCMAFSRRKRY